MHLFNNNLSKYSINCRVLLVLKYQPTVSAIKNKKERNGRVPQVNKFVEMAPFPFSCSLLKQEMQCAAGKTLYLHIKCTSFRSYSQFWNILIISRPDYN